MKAMMQSSLFCGQEKGKMLILISGPLKSCRMQSLSLNKTRASSDKKTNHQQSTEIYCHRHRRKRCRKIQQLLKKKRTRKTPRHRWNLHTIVKKKRRRPLRPRHLSLQQQTKRPRSKKTSKMSLKPIPSRQPKSQLHRKPQPKKNNLIPALRTRQRSRISCLLHHRQFTKKNLKKRRNRVKHISQSIILLYLVYMTLKLSITYQGHLKL